MLMEEKNKKAACFFSIIIPVYNEEKYIRLCLERIFESSFTDFEVIVIDDNSSDRTAQIVQEFPVVLLKLNDRQGPSGARNSSIPLVCGRYLIFTDGDCLFNKQLLEKTYKILNQDKLLLVGGTYFPRSIDGNFAGDFQALFVNFYETRTMPSAYLSTHYMAIEKDLFCKVKGFCQSDFFGKLPSCEDVELSQRLRGLGCDLRIYSDIMVKHSFDFNIFGCLTNAFKKSFWWSQLLLMRNEVFADSGVASKELKITVALLGLFLLILLLSLKYHLLCLISLFLLFPMLIINRAFLSFVLKERGCLFMVKIAVFYCFPYVFSVGLGSFFALCYAALKRIPGEAD
jgi:glycosyltransferase involved in cell wall biosynthesis